MKSWKKYQANEAQTSNPLKVTIMAYDRCILNLKFIKEKHEELKYTEAEARLINTEQIIHELNLGLTRGAGTPEDVQVFVEEMEQLYAWVLSELQLIRMTKQTREIDAIIESLQNLADGYTGALENGI